MTLGEDIPANNMANICFVNDRMHTMAVCIGFTSSDDVGVLKMVFAAALPVYTKGREPAGAMIHEPMKVNDSSYKIYPITAN